jgi:flagellar hook-associated protein 2
MADSTIKASGLATGMDTASIISQLVALESQPIKDISTKESNIKIQVSALADIVSKLNDLNTAVGDLSDGGVFTGKVTSTNTAFSAVASTNVVPGRYSVQVDALASAAKWRSDGLASTDALAAGTLRLTVQGKTYPPDDGTTAPIAIAAGDSLADVAYKIRQSGAPVSAVALTDSSGKSYLSLTSLATGTPLDGSAALAVSFTRAGGATGQSLDFGTPTVTTATNAQVRIDGLTFVRTSNTITDALPGLTLNLGAVSQAAEDAVVDTDADGTQAKLQKLADAYNGVMALLQRQLNVTKDTNRNTSLVGDPVVRRVKAKLQALVATQVPGLGSVRTLADLGLKTARDGSLSIDSKTLKAALANAPSAVNALFSTAGTGLKDLVGHLVDSQTEAGDGLLVTRQDALNKSITDLERQKTSLQTRLDAYQKTLQAQFDAMETTVSQLKSIGSFLTAQSSSSSK